MKKTYVFELDTDVCKANGRDPEAKELFTVMKHYGTLTEATPKTAIPAQTGLTEDEIQVLNTYRAGKQKLITEYEGKLESKVKEIEKMKMEQAARAKRIAELLS